MAFQTRKNGTFEYLTADCLEVVHGFTTRLGGVSQGYLESLNLGLHRGDDPANLLENYRIVSQALGFSLESLVMTRQTHSDVIRLVGRENGGEGLDRPVEPECDGLITNTPGLTLVVFTADCTPILLHDPVTGAVGAVHAGWRGTVADIAGKAVEAMEQAFGSRPEDIQAAIGPNIAQCCFETGSDVPEAVRSVLGAQAEAFLQARGAKFHVDLKGVNEALLRRRGVSQVDVSDCCTACQNRRFWSHRVTQGRRGAQAAIICRKGAWQ